MKYVVFQRMNMVVPVIVPDHCTHADIKIEGFKPISAGFFSIENVNQLNIEGRKQHTFEVYVSVEGSETLKLSPDLSDKKLLEDVLANSGMYAFMSF